MMKKGIDKHLIICCLFFCFTASLFAQTNNPVVMKIGKESITLSEFENTYLKNNTFKNTSEKELRDYIDLYINFRLKYAEAEQLHLDTIEALKEELAGYREQAASGYLTDKDVNERLIKEALERVQWDVRASHIMKQLPLDASPADTLQAYKELLKIRDRILKGESFAKLAETESDDFSARDVRGANGELQRRGNKGDLSYFTAFDMIYSFETAAYNLKKDEISMPVRSQFGYHLIYLQDKQPALGRCSAAQILISYPQNATAQDSLDVKAKIQEAYQAIKNGMDFSEAVEKYCTDKGLVSQKGEMPFFTCNHYTGDFTKHFYGMQKNDISEPFETFYGWHIVKLNDRIPITVNADMEAVLKRKITRDTRSNTSKEAFIERLKKEYRFTESKTKTSDPIQDFYKIDSALIFSGKWDASQNQGLIKPMFSFADQVVTQKDFANYLEENQFTGIQNVSLKEVVNFMYKDFVQKTIFNYENAHLEEKHPEFAALMKEYKEGVLLYELSLQKIWRKAETDTVGLQEFYESIKDDYKYPVRVKIDVYTAKDQKAYDRFEKMLSKKNPEEIMAKLNKKTEVITQKEEIYWERKDKAFDALFNWNQWRKEIEILNNGGTIFAEPLSVLKSSNPLEIIVKPENAFLPPSPKPLSEIKGIAISMYQNALEEEWVKNLRKNNDVWVDYKAILSLIEK